jgi:hypothetical protein
MESAHDIRQAGLKEALVNLEDLSIARADAARRDDFQAAPRNLDETRDVQDWSQRNGRKRFWPAPLSRGSMNVGPIAASSKRRRSSQSSESNRAPSSKSSDGICTSLWTTLSFAFHGATIVGVSADSPSARTMAGLGPRDKFSFRGPDLKIQEVH